MELSIKSLLKTTLISSEKISTDCNIKYDDVVRLTSETLSFHNVSNIIHKKLHLYYKTHKQILLPMHTYLLIRNKFNLHNRGDGDIFLDFFETTEQVIHTVGVDQFKALTGINLETQKTPFFLLENSDEHFVYAIDDFEILINDLNKIKPTNSN